MHWYLATLVFEIQTMDSLIAQFDVQHRIFQAARQEDAMRKAVQKGAEESDFFFSSQRQIIRWKFVGIKDIEQVELADGITLKQETYELSPEESVHFVAFVRLKHQELQGLPSLRRMVATERA